jgi:hypothetical protein
MTVQYSVCACIGGARGDAIGSGTALQARKSRDRFQMVSLEVPIHILLSPLHCGAGVDSVSNRNEYQEYFLWVKAAGNWGCQPYHLHVRTVL